jgi:hypothetical protein
VHSRLIDDVYRRGPVDVVRGVALPLSVHSRVVCAGRKGKKIDTECMYLMDSSLWIAASDAKKRT